MSSGLRESPANMIPVIDKKKTGIHLQRSMDEHGVSVKIQEKQQS